MSFPQGTYNLSSQITGYDTCPISGQKGIGHMSCITIITLCHNGYAAQRGFHLLNLAIIFIQVSEPVFDSRELI